MPELEHELRALGAELEFPPTPDLRRGVRERLAAPRRRVWRRRLAVAVALAAVALGAAFAVPQARTAILRFFGVGAVKVEFVDRLPEVRPQARLDLGERIALADAPFRPLRPRLLGRPDAVYRQGSIVTLLYGSLDRVRLLVTEIPNSGFEPGIGKKLLQGGTRVEFVPLEAANGPAVWIEGRKHVISLPGVPARLAGNTLVWEQGKITVRLEGVQTEGQAIRIAHSMR